MGTGEVGAAGQHISPAGGKIGMKDSGRAVVGLKPGHFCGGSRVQGLSARQGIWTSYVGGCRAFEGMCGGEGVHSSQSNFFRTSQVSRGPLLFTMHLAR